MSEKYTKKDNETTLSIFNKRVIYDFDSQNSSYSNLTDFNFVDSVFYHPHKVDHKDFVDFLNQRGQRTFALKKGKFLDAFQVFHFVTSCILKC